MGFSFPPPWPQSYPYPNSNLNATPIAPLLCSDVYVNFSNVEGVCGHALPLFIDETTQEILITGPQGVFEMILFFLVFEAVASMDLSVKSGLKNGLKNNMKNGVKTGAMRGFGSTGICYVSCSCDGGDVWVMRVYVTLPVPTVTVGSSSLTSSLHGAPNTTRPTHTQSRAEGGVGGGVAGVGWGASVTNSMASATMLQSLPSSLFVDDTEDQDNDTSLGRPSTISSSSIPSSHPLSHMQMYFVPQPFPHH